MRAQKTVKLDMDMCSRPLFGKIILFSLPLVLSGILQLLYNACDIIVVGRFVGTVAMTAVGSTGALVNLIINLFIGLSVGALSATARYIGAQNREEADKIVHTSILISIIGGFVLGIFGFFMAEQFLIWMNTPTNVLPLSTLYLKIFFLGMPFNSLFNFGSSILRACGDTKRPLIFLSIAGVVNVILNLVFVVTFNMSVAGVAIATVISQIISAVLVVICLMKRKGYGRLELRKLKIHWNSLKEILQIGLPAGIQSTIFSISNVIIQASVNSLGDIVMAGNTAAANIEGFVYVSMNSIAQASLTFTGQNYGANKEKNVNLVLLQSLIIVTIVGLVFGLGVFMFGSTLLRIYDTNAEVISYGLQRLSIIATTYFLCGIMDVIVGSLRGIGKSFLPMLVSIIGICVVRIIWVYTVFAETQSTVMLYLAYPISWLLTSIVQLICFSVVKRKVFNKAYIVPPATADKLIIQPDVINH